MLWTAAAVVRQRGGRGGEARALEDWSAICECVFVCERAFKCAGARACVGCRVELEPSPTPVCFTCMSMK